MPGHIKKSEGPDPDPTPWLMVTNELKNKLKSKPYDAKKSIWVPDDNGGFVEALLESEAGGKTIAMVGHEVRGIDLLRCD